MMGPPPGRGGPRNFSPGGMHPRGGGPEMPPPPNMMGGRGPPPPPPRGMPPPPMAPGGGQMPPPPPPMQGHPNHPMNNMQGGPPTMGHPNQPPFHGGPPPPQQNAPMNHPHGMNPQMQNMPPGPPPGPPGPPGIPPNQQTHMQQMHGHQPPPFPPPGPGGGPPPNSMMPPPNNQPPFGQQGFPPQHQQQMQMNPPNMPPQHLQYHHQQQQQQQPIQHIQQRPPHQYPSNNQPPPQAMQHQHQQHQQQQPPHGVQRNAPPQRAQQQPQVSASTSAPSSAASTPSKPASGGADAAWTEHRSPAGVPYYYNTVTGVSTYERPAALPIATSSTSTTPSKDTPAKPTTKTKWQTYTDEATGRKYYSDGATTTWKRPAELPPEEASAGAADKSKQTKRDTSSLESETPRKKKRTSQAGNDKESAQSPYASKAEAIAAFKGLLLAKDVAPTTKWADVVRICQDDARWDAASTTGERKQALAEYQTKRANELRDAKRQERTRAREAFQRLLTEVLPNTKKFAPGASRFVDVRDSLSKDDRFYAVEDETAREELFYEWVEELRKKEERSKRNRRREAKEGCIQFLKSKEEEGKLTFASTWSTFLSSLTPSELADPRFAVSSPHHMSDSDRQLYFSDYVIELQNSEDEKRRRIRDARRRAEKAQRDAFRERLVELAKGGLITPETRWRGVEERVSGDDAFERVQAQGREVARELFEDFVYDWKEEYRRDRVTLVRVWDMCRKKGGFKFDNKSNAAEDFGKALLEASAASPDLYGEVRRMSNVAKKSPLSSIHLFYNELKKSHAAGVAAKNRKNGRANGGKKKHSVGHDESSEDEGEIIEDGEVNASEKKEEA